jgi:hypothetical protein
VPVWEIRCDRAWECKGVGIAAINTSPAGVKLNYAPRLDYLDPSNRCTNNTIEYEALLLGLRKVRALGVLTDKRRIPLRSASVRTPHLFHHGIPKVLVNPRSKGITSVRSTTTTSY